MIDLILDVLVILLFGAYFVVSHIINKRTENLLGHLIIVVSYHSRLLEKIEPNYGKYESLTDGVDND